VTTTYYAGNWPTAIQFVFSAPAFGWHAEAEYYRQHVWITPSGMYSQNQLRFFIAEVGAQRIIHSEDFPYVVRDNVSGFIEQADLTDDERSAIAHRNAENVMRL
jgi:uncharacterized protein